jgi:hypothetical protein
LGTCQYSRLAETEEEGFGCSSKLTLGGSKVDNVAVRLEHVDLLNGRDGLDVHLLEGGLELLVVTTAGSVDLLDLSSGSTLATVFRNTSVSVCARISSEFSNEAEAYPAAWVSRALISQTGESSYRCARHFEDAGALLDP